jgi:SAM-dependent methyltransferase
VCDAKCRRGALAAHAARFHRELVAVVGGLVVAATRLIVLPRGFVLELKDARVSVVCVGRETPGTSLELAFASKARVTVVDGRAEELPFADASFDAAVSAFALCTVADPAAALAELRRVLVPGGALLLLEHVHLHWEPGRGLQSRAAPAWAAVAGGCRLDRDTMRFARDAGFDVLQKCTHVAGWIVEASLRSPVGLQGGSSPA